jgi:hypothetical protein
MMLGFANVGGCWCRSPVFRVYLRLRSENARDDPLAFYLVVPPVLMFFSVIECLNPGLPKDVTFNFLNSERIYECSKI